jgi:uncharacterized membrane protein
MLALTWYDWFKAGHVIVAVLWVGGGATLALLAIMTLRMNDPIRGAQFAHQAGRSVSASIRPRRCSCCCSASA